MFYKFKKGSPEAKAHMAKLRAMVGKKRKKNPLTRKESGQLLREARIRTQQATMHKKDWRREYYGGMAQGISDAVESHGPRSSKGAARKMQDRADRAVGIGRWTGREVNPRRLKRNPPLLVLGNPGGKRRKIRRAPISRFGECPKGFPAHIWRDPEFQRERRVFISRHGANVPIHVQKVKMPPGSPRFMTAYGKAQHAVYDAPKQRRNGTKFIHKFGKRGKRQPWLVSSASKGPKWLGYAGGSFNAKSKWLYW